MPATPRLHPDTIEAVKQRSDIVDVVSEHVVLKKRGKDFAGLCPFHDDKNNPSFTVSPAKQFYYCFACGAGGNSIKFLMELNKSNFADVVLNLANRYGIPVQTLEPEKRQELQKTLSRREKLYEILALTAKFYEHALHQPEGAEALTYLRDQRQLGDEPMQQFQIGYSPAGWSTLHNYLVEQKKYPVALVEQAGLLIERKGGGGYYDRFRNRLMIPIHDLQGRVIGFGGRALGDDQPKYLNSPETELFDKGGMLFGLDKARATIAKDDRAVVVEGYFDVIALHAAGITSAVAALGTALSLKQVKLLLRYSESKRIVLNFDADGAGEKAAQRAIGEVEGLAYQGQVQLRVLNLPDGKDADEFLKASSAGAYRELLNNAPLWIDWQIQRELQGRDLKQAEEFQESIQALVKLLGNLPNTPLRTHYIHKCAELLSQGEARVALQLEEDLRSQVRGQRWHGKSKKWERPSDYTSREVAECQLLQIYLHHPRERLNVRQSLRERDANFTSGAHRFLWRAIRQFEQEQLGDVVNDAEQLPQHFEALADLDLLTPLRDEITDVPKEAVNHILQVLYLDEKAQLDILRPSIIVKAAVATLERIGSEKRCRHLLDSWSRQSVSTIEHCIGRLLEQGLSDGEDADEQIEGLYGQINEEVLQFQRLYYEERRNLQVLDGERLADTTEVLQTPLQPVEVEG